MRIEATRVVVKGTPGESRRAGGAVTRTMVAKRLDDIDMRILSALQRDGRITFQKLSEVVGLSPRPCLERVRRLERERFITGYTARIDMRRLVNLVVVLMSMHVKQGKEIRPRFEQRMRSCPEVLECFEVCGEFDYIVKVACPSLAAYQELTEPRLPKWRTTEVVRSDPELAFHHDLDDGMAERCAREAVALACELHA